MKIFIRSIVAVSFFSLLNFNRAESCDTPIKCDCLAKPVLKKGESVEIGLLYDGIEETPQHLIDLNDFICGVRIQLGDIVKLKRMPGASVTIGNDGIDCGQDCISNRKDGCMDKHYDWSTKCTLPDMYVSVVKECADNEKSDDILIKNGALRCELGIDKSKLPALVFNQKFYDPCTTFNSEQDLLKFVCSLYDCPPDGCSKEFKNIQ